MPKRPGARSTSKARRAHPQKKTEMRLKELNSVLGQVEDFIKPQARLEQYRTPGEMAGRLSQAMAWEDELHNKVIIDLGCGTGMLSMATGLQGAFVIGTDVDADALQQAESTARKLGVWFDGVVSDVGVGSCFRGGIPDSIVMNPPFGTKCSGMDCVFLGHAVLLARRSVYSMHKTSTREFLQRKLCRWQCAPQVCVSTFL